MAEPLPPAPARQGLPTGAQTPAAARGQPAETSLSMGWLVAPKAGAAVGGKEPVGLRKGPGRLRAGRFFLPDGLDQEVVFEA
jgi:hypothetical protein